MKRLDFSGTHLLVPLLSAVFFLCVCGKVFAQQPIQIYYYGSRSPGDEWAKKGGVDSVQVFMPSGGRRPESSNAQMEDIVRLGILNLNVWLNQLIVDKIITSNTTDPLLVSEQLPNLRLFIGGHLMTTLRPISYFPDDPTWYPNTTPEGEKQAGLAHVRSWIEFRLHRDPSIHDSRKDWDEVLRTPGDASRMSLAVGIYRENNNTAHVLGSKVKPDQIDPQRMFRFRRIIWDEWTITGVIIIGLSLLVFIWLAFRSGIVRDPTQAIREDGLPPFSLGRCQMAFWFFLVIGSFYFLWLITGRGDTDTVNGTVLTLLGISAGTALGAAAIRNNQALPGFALAMPSRIFPDELKSARQKLSQLITNRKTIVDSEAITKNCEAIRATEGHISNVNRTFREWKRANRNRFLMDILSENDANSNRRIIAFHRFQIVIWTLILGIVFISDVITQLEMPKFDETLLILLGISSGTYLGFKFQPDTIAKSEPADLKIK